jgi:hypothetical protein
MGCGSSSSKTTDAATSAPDVGVTSDVAPAADAAAPADTAPATADAGADGPPPVTAATTCAPLTDAYKPIAVATTRDVVCALDLGSNNAKLVVMSVDKSKKPETLKDERQCRNKLSLGTKVFDSTTMIARAPPGSATRRSTTPWWRCSHAPPIPSIWERSRP